MNKKTCNLVNATPSLPQGLQKTKHTALSTTGCLRTTECHPLTTTECSGLAFALFILTSTISMTYFWFMCRYENVLVKEIKRYL